VGLNNSQNTGDADDSRESERTAEPYNQGVFFRESFDSLGISVGEPREHDNQGEFQDFRGLKRDSADFEPPLCPALLDTRTRHLHRKHQSESPSPESNQDEFAHENLVFHERNHQHSPDSHCHEHKLVVEEEVAVIVFAGGERPTRREQHSEPEYAQHEGNQEQRHIEFRDPPPHK
jgi:hypothetical protein